MKTTTLAATVGVLLTFANPHALSGAEQTLDGLRHKLASPVYETRVAAVTELLQMGQKKPLSKEEVDLLLPPLKNDEWRIKVRVLLVLPFSANPDWVLQPLISALQDREDESSGGGNVPSGACRALTKLGDSRGLKPCEDWLKFLESNPKAYGDLHASLVKKARQYIRELRQEKKRAKQTPGAGKVSIVRELWPDMAGAGNGAVSPAFLIGRVGPAVPDPQRWP